MDRDTNRGPEFVQQHVSKRQRRTGPKQDVAQHVSLQSGDCQRDNLGTTPQNGQSSLLFSGLAFYFFPSSRSNRARAMKMDKAIQYGATLSAKLTPSVTHVIMDDGMQYQELTKYHKPPATIPSNITVTNGRYLADCITYGLLLEPSQKVYQVAGREPALRRTKSEPIPKLQNASGTIESKPPLVHPSEGMVFDSRVPRGLPPIGPIPMIDASQQYDSQQDGLAKAGSTEYDDDLAKMISEARAIAHLPFLAEPEDDFRGGTTYNHPESQVDLSSHAESSTDRPTASPSRIETMGSPTNVQTSPSKHDIMIMKRPSDGKWVKLRCKECGRSDFRVVRDFVRHVASVHRIRFKSQDDAVEECGFPLAKQQVEAVEELALPGTTPYAEVASIVESGTRDSPPERGRKMKAEHFVCMDKSKRATKDENPNAYTIQCLQQMVDHYERTNDEWRKLSFRRAIGTMRKQTRPVRTKKEALKLPFLGESIAEAIEKIVQTGKLARLEAVNDDPQNKRKDLFLGIYGVGPVQAAKWVNAGFKTLDDVREKAELTENQKIGLERYDDLQLRIPRTEVRAHGDIVKSTLAGLEEGFECTIGGSYRRGTAESGDIDIIFTKPHASLEMVRTVVLERLVPALFESGFLTAELARTSSENGSKWHGCSALSPSDPWRRIDFLFVPWNEMGAALIYFTGNDIFNRSIRLLASRKGMNLNQRGLYKNVLRGRGREKITAGELVEGMDEKRIFEILGVPYRPPEHRNC